MKRGGFAIVIDLRPLADRPAGFRPRAHLLDLRGLLFQVCSESANFFLLLRRRGMEVLLLLHQRGLSLGNRRFLFLHFAVLFEELVEQHRVDRVVAHGIDFAVFVAHHQVGIHLSHFLGNQTKLRRVCYCRSCSGR